jgi:hypothetical protein
MRETQPRGEAPSRTTQDHIEGPRRCPAGLFPQMNRHAAHHDTCRPIFVGRVWAHALRTYKEMKRRVTMV